MTHSSSAARALSRRRLILLGAAVVGGAGLAAERMAAALETDVKQAIGQPLRIALPQIIQARTPAADPHDPQVAIEMTQIIASNLRRSGRFALIDPAAYGGRSVAIDAPPDFLDWRPLDAQVLVIGRLSGLPAQRLRAEFRLWDVLAGQHLLGQMYATTWDSWRRLAHIVSDAIHERLTGERGIFDMPEPEITKP